MIRAGSNLVSSCGRRQTNAQCIACHGQKSAVELARQQTGTSPVGVLTPIECKFRVSFCVQNETWETQLIANIEVEGQIICRRLRSRSGCRTYQSSYLTAIY